jgi:hypothetical protein
MGSNGEVCPAQRSFIRPPKPSRQNHIGTGAPPRHTRPRSICIAGCHHFAGAALFALLRLTDGFLRFASWPVPGESRLGRLAATSFAWAYNAADHFSRARGRRTSFCGTSCFDRRGPGGRDFHRGAHSTSLIHFLPACQNLNINMLWVLTTHQKREAIKRRDREGARESD